MPWALVEKACEGGGGHVMRPVWFPYHALPPNDRNPAYGESAPSYLMVRPPPTRPSPNDIDCAWSILTSRRRYLTAMHSTEGDRKTGSRRSA